MRENKSLGRRLLALTVAVCTLGALAVAPSANAEEKAPVSTGRATSKAAKDAAAKAGFTRLTQCPADNPNNQNNPNEMVYVTPDPNDVGGTLDKGTYVPGLTEALAKAKEYAKADKTADVYIDLVGHQNVPSPDKSNPKTLDVDVKIHLDGQGCSLDGQLNFIAGSAGSTVQNVDFRMTSPNQNTGNILTTVSITVQNNLFQLPNSSVQMQDTANGANKANAKRPVGVLIGGGDGSVVSNNKFQSDSGTGLPAHPQVQGVRLAYGPTNSRVSNNQFDVPTGVALFSFTGTGNIQNNTFSGKYAVADTSASNPNGLTYLGKPIVYGQKQSLNGNVLGNAWPYRSVFAGNGKNGVGEFRGTSYGVKYLYINPNTGKEEILGSDAVVRGTTPTRIPTRDGYNAELYTDATLQTKFNPATDMTNNRDGFGEDSVTSTDAGALYVKWTRTVTYDLNGGTGGDAPDPVTLDETGANSKIDSLPGLKGVTGPAGKGQFRGWSMNKNANPDTAATFAAVAAAADTILQPGTSFTPTAAKTILYAIWAPAKVQVLYNANGGSGDFSSGQVDEGSDVALADGSKLTAPAGKKFGGWMKTAQGTKADYQPGDVLKNVTADVTVYAYWSPAWVYYESEGDPGDMPTEHEAEVDDEGYFSIDSKKPTRSGFTFKGWKTPKGNIYQSGARVPVSEFPDGNYSLMAVWEPASSGGNGGNNGNTGGNGGTGGTVTPGPSNPSNPSEELIDVHRYYNLRSGEHFYTASEEERATLTPSRNWRYEGIAFRMSPNKGQPVYRLYNVRGNGMHLFTTNKVERDTLLLQGWRDEGIPFYVPSATGVQVRRLYLHRNGDHLLTTDENEYGVLMLGKKWRDEGIAFNSAAK